MGNRFNADANDRGSSPFGFGGPSTGPDVRGGFGSAGQDPHSSAGFRRALEATSRGSNRLAGQMPSRRTFSGPGYRKPNYFSQGGARHGMHIGAGAPFVGPAAGDTGEGFGG